MRMENDIGAQRLDCILGLKDYSYGHSASSRSSQHGSMAIRCLRMLYAGSFANK